jgi:hypothetical protein
MAEDEAVATDEKEANVDLSRICDLMEGSTARLYIILLMFVH